MQDDIGDRPVGGAAPSALDDPHPTRGSVDRSPEIRGPEDWPEILTALARPATDLFTVQALVDRLRTVPGVRSAALVPQCPPDGDLRVGPGEVAERVGPEEWRLRLRVAFGDPVTYARFAPVVRELAAAAERALCRPCLPIATAPGSPPPPLYDALGRLSPEIIVVVDPRAGWVVLSDAFGAVLGYRRGSLPPGLALLDLVHPDDRSVAVATFVAACAGRCGTGPVDLRVRTADGRWRTLEVTVGGFVADPLVQVVLYYAVDVTGRREAERAARADRGRLAKLVETLPDGIILVEADGRIPLVNDACLRLLQLDRPREGTTCDWAGLSAALRRTLVDGPARARVLREILAGDQAVAGVELEFVDGRVLELDFVPMRCGGERVGTLVHLRDVTARIAVRRGQTGHAGEGDPHERVLAEVSALNNEFVATVAHELRGPLSSVVAFSCLLGDASSGTLSSDQRNHLEVIDRNANRLLRLIEDLLLLSRLESRTVHLQRSPVRLRDLLGAAVTECEPAAAGSGIELRRELADGPDLLGDEGRLHLVAANLLGNALRYTPRGGRVTVRAVPPGGSGGPGGSGESGGSSGPGSWTVEITDTGIGIPATDLPRLFNTFFRGSNLTAAVGRNIMPGTGLGLVVCRAIVELHGGAIQVASTEGIGTTVTLTLPAGPERTSEVDRESAARR